MTNKNTKYISELDKFLSQITVKNPEIVKQQKILLETWWDKNPKEVLHEYELNNTDLTNDGYVYFNYK